MPLTNVVSDIDGLVVTVRCRNPDPAPRIGGTDTWILPLVNGDLVFSYRERGD
jgi:hypothetical protein